jgi:hemolysin activation/secretion protein
MSKLQLRIVVKRDAARGAGMNQPIFSGTKLSLALLASMIGLQAHGQVRPDAGSTLEQQRPAPQPPQRSPELGVPAPAAPAMKAQPALKVKVAGFRISGNTVFSEAELNNQLRSFVGRELDFAGLNQAAAAITAYYRSRGYLVAQAYLPEQDIKSGTVQIAVLEGRLGSVRHEITPGSRLSASAADSTLRGVRSGSVISAANAERGLLLLNDLPGVRADGTLVPGRNVGEADLVVRVGDDGPSLRGGVELDNHGNRFTGEWRLGGSVRLVNPSGRGDQVALRALRSTDGNLTIGTLGYSLPLGGDGLRAAFSYTYLDYEIGEEFAALGANGEASVFAAQISYPLRRSRASNLYLGAGYDHKELDDRTLATGTTSRTVDTLRFSVNGDETDGFGGGGVTSYSATLSAGDLDIEPTTALAADAAGRRTAGGFEKIGYELSRSQRLTDRASLYLLMAGQLASKNLDSSEKMSLGGPNGVRAYPVGEAAGDNASLITLELRYALNRMLGLQSHVAAFIDNGTAKVNETPMAGDTANARNLLGYGIGLTLADPGRILLRAMIAWRGERETPTSDNDHNPRAWVQMGLQF